MVSSSGWSFRCWLNVTKDATWCSYTERFLWLKGVKLDKGVQCSSFAGKWQRPQHIRTVFAMLTLSKGKYLTQVWGKFCSFFAMHRNGDYWHTVRVDHPASSPHALSVSLQYHYDIKQVKLLMVMQRWVSMRGWENVEDFCQWFAHIQKSSLQLSTNKSLKIWPTCRRLMWRRHGCVLLCFLS